MNFKYYIQLFICGLFSFGFISQNLSGQTIPDLVAYYPFSGNCFDSGQDGLHATNNGAAFSLDRCKRAESALFLNGENAHVILPNSIPSFSGNEAFSISFWIKPSQTEIGKGFLISRHNYHIEGEWSVKIDRDYRLKFHREVEPWSVKGKTVLQSDKWYQVICTYDGTRSKIYLNGNLEAQMRSGQSKGASNTAISIGVSHEDNIAKREFYRGLFDDLRIYSRALNEGETKLLFERESCAETPVIEIDAANISIPKTLEGRIPKTLEGRTILPKHEMSVKSEKLRIRVWDSSEEDQDVISLNLNGEWILENFAVRKYPTEIVVEVAEGKGNFLAMHAINLGSIPPNTAKLSIRDRLGNEEVFSLSSNLNESSAIVIQVKP